MNQVQSNLFRAAFAILSRAVVCLCGTVLFLTACGGGETPTPIVPPPPRATNTPAVSPTVSATPSRTATPTSTPTPLPSPTPSDFFVSILNRRVTRAELAEILRREGSVNVAGWNYAARDEMVQQFQAWVQKEFGVEIQVNYSAEASPQTYLDKLDAARAANKPLPYDVIAAEENYFLDAQNRGLAEKILPSDLLNNAAFITSVPKYEPYALPFQASSTIGATFHREAIGEWFSDWRDLADARLRRRVVLPRADGIQASAFLIGLAGSLGKDYKNADDMRATIDFVCTQIQPNVLKYTNDFSEMQALLRENRIDVAVTWNLLARLDRLSDADGTHDIVFRPMRSGQPAINGYAWIPQNAPHPVLAQLFINWRLGYDGQLPHEAWALSKPAWGEYHEGLLGEVYESVLPDWIKPEYFKMYPSVSEMQELYKPVDWTYFAAHQAEWMQQYSACAK